MKIPVLLLILLFFLIGLPDACQSLPLRRWAAAFHNININSNNNRSLAASTTPIMMNAAASTTEYDEQQVELATGVSMKVTFSKPSSSGGSKKTKKKKPVLLFLHGSFHGGWCWTEKFFPFFLQQGYTVVAPCWRGTGGTYAGDGVKKVKIQEHVADLESLLDQLPLLLDDSDAAAPKQPLVVVAHSFGSLAVMKLLELHPERAKAMRGLVMMCGVPPSGNGKMTMRYLRRSLVASYKITVGFAMKKCLQDASLCRDLFLGGPVTAAGDDHGVSNDDVLRYQGYFARDSKATIDLLDLAKQLPSFTTVEDGKAPFYRVLPPCMVLGAKDDFIVDREGVEETARYFNVQEPIYVDSPHDVMLTNKWRNAANELDQFLKTLE